MGFFGWLLVAVVIVCFIGAMWAGAEEGKQNAKAGRDAGISPILIAKHGALNAHLVCPHCQTKGKVLSKPITRKAGVSGGKATGALLTGGVSLLATGLSRKEAMTESHCAQCSSTWHY